MAEDLRSGEWFQVGLDRVCPCLQLTSSSSEPRARWRGKEKVLDQFTFGTSCGPNQRSVLCTSSAGILVRQRLRRSSTDGTQSLHLTRRMWRMLSLSKTSNILSSVRECRPSKINPASDLPSALAVCSEHRAEVLEFVNIFQGLTIRQDSLALLTRDEC